ncbi:MAG: hypothetical protein BGO03_12010 [Mesorhizobium sp. 61-13]|nr:hypothetical protein [Mesorhizobium sp.]OJU52375.1 MAG: hypothetical protein BGO03_12010 [Mesorhizobium sp. 61-13]
MNDIPRKLKPAERRKVEDEIERLIGLLDTTDTNPDDEPSLGWPNALGPQQFGSTPGALNDDREDDGDDLEPDEDGEFSLGWENEGSQAVLRDSDEYEPELGTTEEIDQVRRLQTLPGWKLEDGEPYLGWVENHGKGIHPDETDDDRESENEHGREDSLDGGATEHGIADEDALKSDEFTFASPSQGGPDFRGEGYKEARKALRELNRKNPPAERAERLPDGVILRVFSTEPPPDDDWRLMHYRAAHDRLSSEGDK